MTAVLIVGVMAPGAAVGAQGGPTPAGPVATEFPPAVPVVDGWYGESVAIDGDRFLVGAPYDDWTDGNTTYYAVGSLWLYTNTGAAWSGTQFLPPFWQDGDDSYSHFGESSDIDGDTFVAGAWAADGNVDHVRNRLGLSLQRIVGAKRVEGFRRSPVGLVRQIGCGVWGSRRRRRSHIRRR